MTQFLPPSSEDFGCRHHVATFGYLFSFKYSIGLIHLIIGYWFTTCVVVVQTRLLSSTVKKKELFFFPHPFLSTVSVSFFLHSKKSLHFSLFSPSILIFLILFLSIPELCVLVLQGALNYEKITIKY